MPVLLAFTMGFILKAVGPGLVVPAMFQLQKIGLGRDQGGWAGRAGGRAGWDGWDGWECEGQDGGSGGQRGRGCSSCTTSSTAAPPPPPAGIPSTVVIAASFDDIIAITGYSIFSSIAITGQGDVAWQIASGPLQARTRAPRCLCGLGSGDRRVASSTLDSRLDVLSSSVP